MALTYQQSSELMNNQVFRGRIKVACLKFASYIMSEDVSVPAHNTRMKWAQQTFQMPEAAASQVTPPVVMDPAVQEAAINAETGDSTIEDTALQSAVESVVNKTL